MPFFHYIILQAPVEVEPYEGEFDATDDGNVCPQYDIGSGGPAGDEDCLNLNVYTPKIDGKKRAVMVYIHGGAFIMGGGASYFFGPNYLLENDVVLVTFNYRYIIFCSKIVFFIHFVYIFCLPYPLS